MPAATPALSDSAADVIGIPATTSQFSRTSRDSPLPSEPDDEHQRHRGELHPREVERRLAVQPHDVQAGLAVGLQRPGQVGGPRHRHPGRRTGRDLPRGGGHAGRAAGRHDHAVRAEGGRRPEHGAEVARVGDAVERDEQRRLVRFVARASRSSGCA